MKRLLSLMLVFSMLIVSVPVFADGGQQIEPIINIVENKTTKNQTTFAVEWSINDIKAGDYFNITFPFNVVPPQADGVEVKQNNNEYTFIFTESFVSAKGTLGGTKTVQRGETLDQLSINGIARPEVPETPNYNGGEVGEHNTEGRDVLYKEGTINGDTINWIVTLGADGDTDLGGLSVTDEIGDGHILVKDSVKFANYTTNDDVLGYSQDDLIEDLEVTDTTIDFKIKKWYPRTYIHLSYQTKITDKNQTTFSNQLIVEDEQKLTESVTIDSWGDIDVEKPEPKPEEPEEPEELPQVGEFFARPEYIIAVLLLIVARFMRKKEK